MLNLDFLMALLLFLLGALGLSDISQPDSPQPADITNQTAPGKEDKVGETERIMTNIFQVEVTVMESWPMQIMLDVSGEHPDGCDLPVQVAQRRDGNNIQVEVYRELPYEIVCPMILRPYSDNIMLEGRFESGEYSISVNAHTQSIDI